MQAAEKRRGKFVSCPESVTPWSVGPGLTSSGERQAQTKNDARGIPLTACERPGAHERRSTLTVVKALALHNLMGGPMFRFWAVVSSFRTVHFQLRSLKRKYFHTHENAFQNRNKCIVCAASDGGSVLRSKQ